MKTGVKWELLDLLTEPTISHYWTIESKRDREREKEEGGPTWEDKAGWRRRDTRLVTARPRRQGRKKIIGFDCVSLSPELTSGGGT